MVRVVLEVAGQFQATLRRRDWTTVQTWGPLLKNYYEFQDGDSKSGAGPPMKPAPVETQGSKSTLEVRTGRDSGRDWMLRRNFLPMAFLVSKGHDPQAEVLPPWGRPGSRLRGLPVTF